MFSRQICKTSQTKTSRRKNKIIRNQKKRITALDTLESIFVA